MPKKGLPFIIKGSVNVEDCNTNQEVMIKSGLDWEVDKCSLYGAMPGLLTDANKDKGFLYGGDYFSECENYYGVYRTDCNIILGIVKGRYTTVNNIEAFNFFDKAIGKNKAIFQTAGFFGNGERIFVSVKLPNSILVNGKDPVDNYLVFVNSHNGLQGLKILLTPIRVVCENTLNAAIENNSSYISIRHTNSIHKKIDIANQVLEITKKKTDILSTVYTRMANTKITDEDAIKHFGNVIFTKEELQNIKDTNHNIQEILKRQFRAIDDSEVSMKKVNTLGEMVNYYYTGYGQKDIIGTNWGVYNAVSGYYSNVDNITGEKRMDSLLFGDKANKIALSGEQLVA